MNQIVVCNNPFVFQEAGGSTKHEIFLGIAVTERKRWRKNPQVKVICSFQGRVQSRWMDVTKVNPASFYQRSWAYHELENNCVCDPQVNWLLPEISTALFLSLDKYVPQAAIDRATKEIKKRYAEPHRFWHSEKHVREVLLFLLKHINDRHHWLLLDAIFHDISYDVYSVVNEENSAHFMKESMRDFDLERLTHAVRLGFSLPEEVPFKCWPKGNYERGILATKTHDTDDPLIALLVDADMEVLGGSLNRYRRYARAIRKEYGKFDDAAYANGRTKFLNGLLNRPRIFISEAATDTMEARARQNMQWEITMLRDRQPL